MYMYVLMSVVTNLRSDKGLQFLCILPFGTLYLSAIRMVFVKIILAGCMLLGIVVSAKVNSVSSVNCSQSAFL